MSNEPYNLDNLLVLSGRAVTHFYTRNLKVCNSSTVEVTWRKPCSTLINNSMNQVANLLYKMHKERNEVALNYYSYEPLELNLVQDFFVPIDFTRGLNRGVNNSFEGRTGFGILRDFQGFFEYAQVLVVECSPASQGDIDSFEWS